MSPTPSSPPAIASVDPTDDGYRVAWTDGHESTYPCVALRHACACAECRVPSSGQRLYDLGTLGNDFRAEVHDFNDHEIEFTFTDARSHRGVVRSEALRAHKVSTTGCRSAGLPLTRHQPDATVDFARDLVVAGVALIGGRPATEGEVLRFGDELGYVRQTNYGTSFDVRSMPNPDNLAYSSVGLSPHTDNPYRDPCPSVQLLHCIRPATTGGESILVDGLAVAAQLRDSDPAAFEVLSSTSVRFRYADDEAILTATAPIIETNGEGEPIQVRFNNRSLEAPIASDAPLVDFYRCYLLFARLLTAPEAEVTIRLEPGDILGLDNRRVLHGRTGFDLAPESDGRLLQGCYIDIDAVKSMVALADR